MGDKQSSAPVVLGGGQPKVSSGTGTYLGAVSRTQPVSAGKRKETEQDGEANTSGKVTLSKVPQSLDNSGNKTGRDNNKKNAQVAVEPERLKLQRLARFTEGFPQGAAKSEAISYVTKAGKALEDGKPTDYKQHVDQALKALKRAADDQSDRAYRDIRNMDFSKLHPTYGNWGGKEWSGGWDKQRQPINLMDAAFMNHDKKYAAAEKISSEPEKNRAILKADQELVKELFRIDNSEFERRPYINPLVDSFYKSYAIGFFELKVLYLKTKLQAEQTSK
mgnify:FL=1